ncbi:DUF2867 domain-containing protein [Nocardioides islandensis]|uniref:DUF2867 domain-containing protein n=1 Tax=Nocardioides islandensis TaxID=433663 RepID=A0A930VD75_9ACTN|nr:DUF2867 domain-containing protein [Nocardioides islandensis]MBF4762457.1 DUF2867 domain-containing protein [Nocardioides islandensis]
MTTTLIHHHPTSTRTARARRTTATVRVRPGNVATVPLPSTPLLACALLRVDWSDAYAAALPRGVRDHPPEAWAEAVFHGPPFFVRALFVAREALVRLSGIEAGDRHAFDLVARSPHEVLLGITQRHLGFRASVLVQPDRVVVSTIVEIRNRRGRAYFALVRRIHPWVVRSMLARAVQKLAVPA